MHCFTHELNDNFDYNYILVGLFLIFVVVFLPLNIFLPFFIYFVGKVTHIKYTKKKTYHKTYFCFFLKMIKLFKLKIKIKKKKHLRVSILVILIN